MNRVCKTAVMLLLGTAMTGSVSAQMRKMPTVKVPCGKVISVSNVVSRVYTGKIYGSQIVNIVPRVSGYLEKTCFKQGDLIKKGDLLYRIEDVNYKATLDASIAKVEQIDAGLKYAKSQLDRNERLFKQKAVSEVTIEDCRRAYLLAQAMLQEAKANLVTARTNYSYTKIYSPITGIVGKSAIPDGNYITPASGTLVTITPIDPMYVIFSMSERDYYNMFGERENLLKNGVLTVELPNGKIYPEKGWIYVIDNQVDSDTGTLKIWGMIRNPKNILTSGSLINVTLSRKTTEKVTAIVPSALMTDSAGSYVFVVENGKAVRRNVKLGEFHNDQQIITGGLKPGEVIVTDGTHKVYPGSDIIPLFEGSKK